MHALPPHTLFSFWPPSFASAPLQPGQGAGGPAGAVGHHPGHCLPQLLKLLHVRSGLGLRCTQGLGLLCTHTLGALLTDALLAHALLTHALPTDALHTHALPPEALAHYSLMRHSLRHYSRGHPSLSTHPLLQELRDPACLPAQPVALPHAPRRHVALARPDARHLRHQHGSCRHRALQGGLWV